QGLDALMGAPFLDRYFGQIEPVRQPQVLIRRSPDDLGSLLIERRGRLEVAAVKENVPLKVKRLGHERLVLELAAQRQGLLQALLGFVPSSCLGQRMAVAV